MRIFNNNIFFKLGFFFFGRRRLPPCAEADYKEKVWDHAAGVIIVEEAGGKVTDASGTPLDWAAGRYIEVGGGASLTLA